MATIRSIKKEKQNIIKNFKPEEMTAYLENLVAIYYETFLEQDLEKHLAVNKLIEEAVELYEKAGYNNTSKNELIFKLNKANELLGKSLEEKEKLKVDLSKVIVENGIENNINRIMFSNSILRRLIESYEEEPSGTLASTIKDIVERVETELLGIKYLLDNRQEVYNSIYAEEYEILAEEYSIFQDSQKKINSFKWKLAFIFLIVVTAILTIITSSVNILKLKLFQY